MARLESTRINANPIRNSWTRCQQQHKLERDASHPIMRLQSSEIAPRLEYLLDRTAGCHEVFEQLAASITSIGNCLVIADENGILVRLDSTNTTHGTAEWNGITLGSCWDERIAGTNGVSMALLEGKACTVRGPDHFFSKLARFSCTATPILDAENQMIGVLSMSAIDRKHAADYLFARHLLEAAADRIQRSLFERKYRESRIVSMTMPDHKHLFRSHEMIAINNEGIIVGTTANAHSLTDLTQPADLLGKSFELIFEADSRQLRIPERVLSIARKNGAAINFRTHISSNKLKNNCRFPKHNATTKRLNYPTSAPRRLAPSFKELTIGSTVMEAICTRSNNYFHRALPFLIQGDSGTGKTALVAALHEEVKLPVSRVLTIDSATIDIEENNCQYFRTVIEQARAISALEADGEGLSTMVFDNVDELPDHAQAGLRNLLSEMELSGRSTHQSPTPELRIIATCRRDLKTMVDQHKFRDDLYYLLAGTVIQLPLVSQRERLDKLIRSIARSYIGSDVEITDEAWKALLAYDWPGNVRQLRSVLKQAFIEGDGNRISLIDLYATPVTEERSLALNTETKPADTTTPIIYDERTMLIDALGSAKWNVSKAARNLGMGRATIHRKMKVHGIARPKQRKASSNISS